MTTVRRLEFSLIQQLRGAIRDETIHRPQTATVIEIGLSRIRVRASNGSVLNDVPVIGSLSDLSVNSTVFLLWDEASRPTALISPVSDVTDALPTEVFDPSQYFTKVEIARMLDGKADAGTVYTLYPHNVWRIQSGLTAQYSYSALDLDQALAEAEAGDLIMLPPISIRGDHAMVAQVRLRGWSREMTKLTGKITGADQASIENLTISRAANNSSELYAVRGPDTGTLNIKGCDITVSQAGSGRAEAVYTDQGGNVVVWDSDLYASSVGGQGYGVVSAVGKIYLRHSRCIGSTDRMLVV